MFSWVPKREDGPPACLELPDELGDPKELFRLLPLANSARMELGGGGAVDGPATGDCMLECRIGAPGS